MDGKDTDLIRKNLKKIEEQVDFAQVNVSESDNDSINIKNNKIENYLTEKKRVYLVKLWVDGKEGFSYGNNPDMELFKKAIKIARLNERKKDFFGLPQPDTYQRNDNYDKEIVNLDTDDMIQISKNMIKDIRSDNIGLIEGDVERSISKNRVLNSNGIDHTYNTTDFAVFERTLTKDRTTYDDYTHKSRLFDVNSFSKQVKDKALLFSNPTGLKDRYKTQEQNIVFNRDCFSSLLHNAFLDGLNGKNILNHNSIFTDKIDKKLFHPELNIVDDATLSKGVNSRPLDAEGTASRKTELIKDGKLKNYITDFNTGKSLGVKSTGNAYEKDIDFTNLIITGPHQAVDRGLYVDSIIGAHTSNSLTTDFSINVERAYYFEGDKKTPVHDFMISGKMIDVLKNIISIDKNKDDIQKNGVYTGEVTVNRLNIN